MRSYVAAISAATPPPARSADLVSWLAWANDYLASVDPCSAPERAARSLHPDDAVLEKLDLD